MTRRKVDLDRTGVYILPFAGLAQCQCCNKANYTYNSDHGVSESNRVKLYRMIVVNARPHSIGRHITILCATCRNLVHSATQPPKRRRKPQELHWTKEVDQLVLEAERCVDVAVFNISDVEAILRDADGGMNARSLSKDNVARIAQIARDAEQLAVEAGGLV